MSSEDAYEYFLICLYANSYKAIHTRPVYVKRRGSGITSYKNFNFYKNVCREGIIVPLLRDNLKKYQNEGFYCKDFENLLNRLERFFLRRAVNFYDQISSDVKDKARKILLNYYYFR